MSKARGERFSVRRYSVQNAKGIYHDNWLLTTYCTCLQPPVSAANSYRLGQLRPKTVHLIHGLTKKTNVSFALFADIRFFVKTDCYLFLGGQSQRAGA